MAGETSINIKTNYISARRGVDENGDDDLLTGDDVIDVETDLGEAGESISVMNIGSVEIGLAISFDGNTYKDTIYLGADEIFEETFRSIKKIKAIHLGDDYKYKYYIA